MIGVTDDDREKRTYQNVRELRASWLTAATGPPPDTQVLLVGSLMAEPGEGEKQRHMGQYYLHPALPSLRAYILPMSPMPMRPTVKSLALGNGAIADAIFSQPRTDWLTDC